MTVVECAGFCNEVQPPLNDLFEYFDDTYIGSNEIARYAVEDWNVHDTVETHLGRTNNAIEGWHSALNKRFRKANPPFSTLIFELKEEELDAQSRIQRYRINPSEGIAVRTRLKKYVRVDKIIQETVKLFDATDAGSRSFVQHLGVLQNALCKY
ncbi:hypothetical protein QR680_016340 [Steinernema hermaphroditum]|uniref:MULE transposase domain-containing protein n=1 Tax=Steinernema hermaphroditum TaxID=289476 RepID=A0AA39HB85_9BILA|nr:hypothetical protein QR680_016340 [Steinernema hermaphroditum]